LGQEFFARFLSATARAANEVHRLTAIFMVRAHHRLGVQRIQWHIASAVRMNLPEFQRRSHIDQIDGSPRLLKFVKFLGQNRCNTHEKVS
jgi:hypothetical protein